MNIPGFTAEASLGSVSTLRTRRANKARLATGTIRPALISGGGGGGYYCSPDDPNCVDCNDDVENTVCQECQAGGNLQCCQDDDNCVANPRPTLDCTNPVNANCLECAGGVWSPDLFPCCFSPCNVIPAKTLPPPCFRFGALMICNLGVSINSANFAAW